MNRFLRLVAIWYAAGMILPGLATATVAGLQTFLLNH